MATAGPNSFGVPPPRSSQGFDPRVKLILTLTSIVGISLMDGTRWSAYAAVLGGLMAVAAYSGLGPLYALRRSYVAIPFALAALSLPFTVPGQILFQMPILGWAATSEGLVRCVSLILRSWLAVQVAILLTGTTPTDWIFWSLRALRAPGILVAVVRFAYRYLALMADEARRMLRARAARSARLSGRPSLAWQGTVTGAMAGSLFVRSLERSERVYAAMLARGYDGRIRMAASPEMRRRDWLMLALAAVGLTALVVVIGR